MIQRRRELVNTKQIDNFSPVHYACYRGNLAMLQLLISHGGDVLVKSKNGVTCLHLACVSGNLDVVKLLVERHRMDAHVTSQASSS